MLFKEAVEAERHEQAERAAGEGEHHALEELMRDQAAARCAEGGPDREVAHPVGGAGELQVGEVGAGDQEDKPGKSQQEPVHPAVSVVHQGLLQRPHAVAQTGVVLGMLLLLDRGERARPAAIWAAVTPGLRRPMS